MLPGKLLRTLCAFLLLASTALPCPAAELRLVVASNFNTPMLELAKLFEQQTSHHLKLSFTSSGKAFAQISNGAPFDAFFSADRDRPAQLEASGLGVSGSRFTYAVGALILWSSVPGRQDLGIDLLKRGTIGKLAIANPRHAPYGIAAMQVLDNLGIEQLYRDKLVLGENVNQAFHFVSSGNADLGLISVAQVSGVNSSVPGSGWRVPASLYQPIQQDAIMLESSTNKAAVAVLFAFFRSPSAVKCIQSFGYQLPAGDVQ